MQKQRHGAPPIRYNTNTNVCLHWSMKGPDGGGGGGTGYGGGGGGASGGGGGAGGVRTVGAAPPPQQQDKAPPPLTITHPAPNHMMGAYHQARPPAQPPPSGSTLHPFIHYTTNPATALRPNPRQHQLAARPAPALIPFFPETAMNTLCAPFTAYSSPLPVPLMYPGSTGASDTGRGQPPQGPFSWGSPAQPSVTIMTTQPQTAQPNPQQQPQAQPSPFQQSQYAAYMQPRVHQAYNTAGGGAANASAGGMQQAPPNTVLVDSRPLPPQQPSHQVKKCNTRKNRIPIIHPLTGMEVDVEDKNVGGSGPGGGLHIHQEHSGGGHHQHLHHSSNQVSSSAGNNALIAADFAKQVAQVAMNNETPSSRPPREDEPQVNGPAGVALGPSPVVVEESTIPTSKRPAGPTPVVSAQAEGTTYDIQSIRSNSSRNVEIRSSESSPARSKAPSSQSAPAPAPVVQSEVVTHAPVVTPAPQIIPSPIQIQEQQVPPPAPVAAEPPKQQRRPRPVPDNKEKLTQQSLQPKPPSQQIEEKEEEIRTRTPSSSTRTPVIQKEEEPPKQTVVAPAPVIKAPPPTQTKQSSTDSIGAKSQPHVEKQHAPPSSAQTPQAPAPVPVVEPIVKPVEVKVDRNPPVEKPVEKVVPEPAVVIEKQATPEPPVAVEPPRITKVIEKRAVSPAVATVTIVPSAAAVTAAPPPAAPKIKTSFAEGFSMENMKMMSAKALNAAAQTATQTSLSQQQQSADQMDSTESSHAQTKPTARTKQKTKHKLREMNQKGVEKEGTDMDAFVDTKPLPSQQPALLTDNNNRTTSNDSLANKQQNSDISNRTATTPLDSNKDNRNSVDNALRPGDATSRTDSNNKNDRDKSPAAAEADATNNNSIINQQYEDTDDDDIVAAKNEENMKKSSSIADSNSTDSSQVISAPPPSQPSLKYQYKDDQWSPLNPVGKKVYDRDFLMKLREDPLSSKKPEITPELEQYVRDMDTVGGAAVGGVRRGIGSHSHSSYGALGFGPSGGSMRGSGNNGLYPDFSRSLSQRMPPKRNSQGGGGNRGPGGGGGRSLKMYNSVSMRDDFKLNQSENAWKPGKLTRGQDIRSKDEREVNELHKKVRGILNKLTPQKFDTLVQQFQGLPISNLERMQGTIKLVFEKAVDEPAFSTSYANLCKVLARMQVAENQGGGGGNNAAPAPAPQPPSSDQNPPKNQQSINFRKILITRCQQEFETNKKMEMDFEKRQVEINECPDIEKRKELQLLFNEEERKIRMKSVGLVTFIGELFKLKMLTANIMHGCIKQLLSKIDEESLECLCKLLTTIGKEFEEQITQKHAPGGGIHEFNEYFVQMTKLSKKHDGSKVSSRVRFMLQDVIELRQNSWVPRRDENKPRTMAQIQEEVDRETEKAAILAAQPLRSISQNMNQDRGGPRRNNQRGGNIQNEDGWTNVKYTRSSYATESTKIQGLKSAAGQELEGRSARGESMTLAPPSFNRWCAGAGSSNRAIPSSNTFTVLDSAEKKSLQAGAGSASRTSFKTQTDDKDKDREKALQTVSHFYKPSNNLRNDGSRERDNSRGRGGPTGGSPSPSLSGPPSRKPQEPQRRPTEGAGGRSDSSRESTPSLLSQSPAMPMSADKQAPREMAPPSEPKKDVDPEKQRKQTNTIMEEYFSFQNIQECIENFKDWFADCSDVFVSICLESILELSKEDKRMVASQLLGELNMLQMYPASVLVQEIENLFEIIYDLEVDIPHIWKYMGEIIGQLMLMEVIDFSHFKQATSALSSNPSGGPNKIHLTLREIFRILLLEKVPAWVKEKWDSSSIQLSELILDKKLMEEFLSENSFLEGKEVAVRDSSIPFEKVQEKLLTFLKGSNYQFDQICSWLSVNVGKRMDNPMFIRQLTEAVIKASIFHDDNGNTPKLNKDLLIRHSSLIKRYVDYKEELELWCLYSVQYLVVITLESPSGMLVDIFQVLYESLVISPEGFNKWRQEESLCQGWQNEGRGVAIASSKSFFTQMEQDINDEHEDEDLPS